MVYQGIRAGFIASVLFLAGIMLPCTVFAEQYQGSARVGVWANNLEAAREDALLRAKYQALLRACEQLVSPALLRKRKALLRAKVFPLHMRLIRSFRAVSLEPSLDKKQYRAVILAIIMTEPLERVLKQVGLLSKSKEAVILAPYYLDSDATLAKFSALRQETFARITARLKALGFEVDASPKMASASQIRTLITGQNTGIVVVRTTQKWDFNTHLWQITLRIYAPNQGGLIGQFTQRNTSPSLQEPWNSDARAAWGLLLLKPLTKQMQPQRLSSMALQTSHAQKTDTLRVRVRGLHSAEEENAFLNQFLKHAKYVKSLHMVQLGADGMEYIVRLKVSRKKLLAHFKSVRSSYFHLDFMRFSDDNSALDIALTPKIFAKPAALQLFPESKRPSTIARKLRVLLETPTPLSIGDPRYREVEDNGWFTKPNQVPFAISIYGEIDSRGDIDMYLVDGLKPKERVEILWLQVGRTQLRPEIRVYDLKRKLILLRRVSDWSRIVFNMPQKARAFYFQIGDRYGYIPGELGGYLRYDYLFKVKHRGKSRTAPPVRRPL